MRKSLAPSQKVAKPEDSFVFKVPEIPKRTRECRKRPSESSSYICSPRPAKQSVSEHEMSTRRILSRPFRAPIADYVPEHSTLYLSIERVPSRKALHDPYACNALVLFEPPELSEHEKIEIGPKKVQVHVVVDPLLGNILRPHQREGVKFMYECVTGKKGDFQGCIMADETGLGKPLQAITLLWTLLRQGPDCKPLVNKAIIVCPSVLVQNWHDEFEKWLGSRLNCLAIDDGSKEKTTADLEQFIANQRKRSGTPVLIIGYETFRLYAHILNNADIEMVLCDDAHQLENCDNDTYEALKGMKTKRRILFTGTPIQTDDLTKYYSLLNFVNPDMLGSADEFRRQFENPISCGQNAESTEAERVIAAERLQELTALVSQCMIRRTSSLLDGSDDDTEDEDFDVDYLEIDDEEYND